MSDPEKKRPSAIRDVHAEGAAEKSRLESLRRELEACAARVADSPDGKELINHLCLQFGVGDRLSIPDKEGGVDPHRAAIREGEQAVVFHILKLAAKGSGAKTITIPLKQIP